MSYALAGLVMSKQVASWPPQSLPWVMSLNFFGCSLLVEDPELRELQGWKDRNSMSILTIS